MTRHMYKVHENRERKQQYRTPEQRRRRRQVLLEALDMLRDGVLKFQKDLDDAHATYERNMNEILKTSRATRAAWVGATGATSPGTCSPGADAQGVEPTEIE